MALPENETRLDAAALERLLASGAWRREGQAITRTFTFKGFNGAMAFANRVAQAANEANHHPDIHIERYKTVRIVLTTHATGGISDADVELARRIDELENATRPP
ncbi:MAG: 4a-hydroxytetrahydrobiopterin dehydratase [Candidatus Limnocylindria bacterium]